MEIFTVEDFIKLKELIYKRTGIKFEERKIYFVKRRVIERMKELGLSSGKEFYRYLRLKDRKGHEFQKLVNLLTTNETYFFREFYQLEIFGEVLLPEFEERKKKEKDFNLRIWSAGCSSGEEPYTLSIIVMEILDNYKSWNIEIIATDIDERVLEKAQRGVYGKRSVKDVPPAYLEKYFIQKDDENFLIKDSVRKNVKFKKLNLIDSYGMSNYRYFDFIFCRNVLIYFDDESRKKVVSHFYNALNPGGFIFLGHSESLSRITTAFKMKKVRDIITYYKPEH